MKTRTSGISLLGHDLSLCDFQTAFSDSLSNGVMTTEDLSLKAQAILTSLMINPFAGHFPHIEVIYDNLLESLLVMTIIMPHPG